MRPLAFPLLLLSAALCAEDAKAPPVLSLPEKASAFSPALASGPDGLAWLAYASPDGGIYASSWKPGEKEFSKPVLVAAAAKDAKPMVGMHRGPRISGWDKGLAVSWIAGDNLLCARSADGVTWKPPVRVNAEAGTCGEGLHAMAASGGQLWCCWLAPKSILLACRSKDGGASFGDPFPVQEDAVCSCCHPSLAAGPGGALTVMFRNDVKDKDKKEEYRDLHVADLDAKKTRFGEARKLGKGTWKLMMCPMDGGGCAFGKGLATVWRRDRMILATLGNDSEERPLGAGKDPAVAALASGEVLAVWTDKDAVVRLRLDAKAGVPARVAGPEAGTKQGLAAVVSLPGGFLAAWEERPAGGGESTVKARWIPAGG